jgi:Spy/CpxP family protein refolding chaperone
MFLRRVSVLSLLMLSLGSTAAFAAPNPKPSHHQYSDAIAQQQGAKPQKERDNFFEKLNLTPEQKAKIESIRTQSKDQSTSQREAFKKAEQELRTLIGSNADDNQIREKHNQLITMKQQLETSHFETMLAIRDVLTPEQRTQLDQLMKQNSQNHTQNHKNQGQHPNNPTSSNR